MERWLMDIQTACAPVLIAFLLIVIAMLCNRIIRQQKELKHWRRIIINQLKEKPK